VVVLMNSRVATTVGGPLRLDSLLASGLTLGLKAGVSLGSVLDQKIRAQGLVPLETVLDIPQLLKLVQQGRMDYTLMAEEEALYLLSRDPSLTAGLTLLHLVDAPPGNQRHFLYSGTFDVAWRMKIDEAIERVLASPRYRELISVVP
jgi:ABC-type amino acid transport substrate-binding protein